MAEKKDAGLCIPFFRAEKKDAAQGHFVSDGTRPWGARPWGAWLWGARPWGARPWGTRPWVHGLGAHGLGALGLGARVPAHTGFATATGVATGCPQPCELATRAFGPVRIRACSAAQRSGNGTTTPIQVPNTHKDLAGQPGSTTHSTALLGPLQQLLGRGIEGTNSISAAFIEDLEER